MSAGRRNMGLRAGLLFLDVGPDTLPLKQSHVPTEEVYWNPIPSSLLWSRVHQEEMKAPVSDFPVKGRVAMGGS